MFNLLEMLREGLDLWQKCKALCVCAIISENTVIYVYTVFHFLTQNKSPKELDL